ncbi:hypothetical protein GCM10010109_12660 [Actinoplanes campanulatus]|nr:hypothetical protein GCM10010109_12660 [Actinoplanes campanulatus]GID35178.1 hypothetical protein Aca09nite_16840 [Actinoplanes campanulatus]
MGGDPGTASRPADATMPFEASFDDDGRLADYRFTPTGAAAQTAAKSATRFYDYGVPVDVKAPPAAEIMTS